MRSSTCTPLQLGRMRGDMKSAGGTVRCMQLPRLKGSRKCCARATSNKSSLWTPITCYDIIERAKQAILSALPPQTTYFGFTCVVLGLETHCGRDFALLLPPWFWMRPQSIMMTRRRLRHKPDGTSCQAIIVPLHGCITDCLSLSPHPARQQLLCSASTSAQKRLLLFIKLYRAGIVHATR